jgi:hypothetical protein
MGLVLHARQVDRACTWPLPVLLLETVFLTPELVETTTFFVVASVASVRRHSSASCETNRPTGAVLTLKLAPPGDDEGRHYLTRPPILAAQRTGDCVTSCGFVFRPHSHALVVHALSAAELTP